ncbi:hypothetical protein KFL_002250240 [Klebsormidium nitens]|uniref:Uncharacterized protein n=1 Tax=Klebsormidium nitens TaxID=105231 RepID=A0A1Y1I2U7_KLENI|nr:hypothetical protein KFL_002250240 [Klebsormidium nitens]|eukprot:GAQ85244.1 hypothetical protein KFL_002250240 [Klebsormidium nitens]
MGAADSKEAPAGAVPGVVTVASRQGAATTLDPNLAKLLSLKAGVPLLSKAPSDNNLKDVLLRRTGTPSTSPGTLLDTSTTLQLFSKYEAWANGAAAHIASNQEDIHNSIDVVEELALKLLQRLHHAAQVMKQSAEHLHQARSLKDDVDEVKQQMSAVLASYEALCGRLEGIQEERERETRAASDGQVT